MALRQLTYNEVVQRIEDWASAHKQLNHFQEADPWEFNTSGNTEFPAMLLQNQPGTVGDKVYTYNFTAFFMDLVDDGERNEREVKSDMQLIALDFVAQLTNTGYEWQFDRSGKSVIPFTERFDSEVTGWTIDIGLSVPFDWNKCQIPETAINIPTSFRDNEVTITDANNPLSPIIKTGGETYACLALNTIAYRRPGLTGQITSYRTNDDGDNFQNGTYQYSKLGKRPILQGESALDADGTLNDFFLLSAATPNAFGTLFRFTDENGDRFFDSDADGLPDTKNVATAYDNDYMIDHLTGLAYIISGLGSGNWNAAIDGATAHTAITFTDFRVPNVQESDILMCHELAPVLSYEPFGLAGDTTFWTSTTVGGNSTRALQIVTQSGMNNGGSQQGTKTITKSFIYVRNHYT